MKIKTLIFSKDRAMQLDATLRSFFLHCRDAELAKISVLYLATTPRTRLQYACLQKDFPTVSFVPQTHFHLDVLNIISPFPTGTWKRSYTKILSWPVSIPLRKHSLAERIRRKLFNRLIFPLLHYLTPIPHQDEFIFFIVDDNLFVREFNLSQIITALQTSPLALGFSLRLGMNTTFAYTHNSKQALPKFSSLKPNIFQFNWLEAEHDFNYPLEISSSIYRAAQIIPLINALMFENPNLLEGAMAARTQRYSKDYQHLLCFGTSVAFCNPVNIVQNVELANRSGLEQYYPVDLLSEKFDQGERIDINMYADFVPNACHQEVPLTFRPVSRP
jgi:hypothetical protein